MNLFGIESHMTSFEESSFYDEFSFQDVEISTALESIDFINNQLGLEAEETKTENKENIFKRIWNKIKELINKLFGFFDKFKPKRLEKIKKQVQESLDNLLKLDIKKLDKSLNIDIVEINKNIVLFKEYSSLNDIDSKIIGEELTNTSPYILFKKELEENKKNIKDMSFREISNSYYERKGKRTIEEINKKLNNLYNTTVIDESSNNENIKKWLITENEFCIDLLNYYIKFDLTKLKLNLQNDINSLLIVAKDKLNETTIYYNKLRNRLVSRINVIYRFERNLVSFVLTLTKNMIHYTTEFVKLSNDSENTEDDPYEKPVNSSDNKFNKKTKFSNNDDLEMEEAEIVK